MFVYKVVQTSRLYEQIVQQIEESILKGTLKEGDQLPAERELAQQFVSVEPPFVRPSRRSTKRACGRFSRARDVHREWQFKFYAPVSGPHSQERYFGRCGPLGGNSRNSGTEIAALAAARADEQDIATMREAVSVMDNARHDPDAFIEADLDFHLSLAEAAANPSYCP